MGKGIKKYKDTGLKNFEFLTHSIENENNLQFQRWGIQNRTLPEWLMYATEEIGELSEAISEYIYRKGNEVSIINEAIQTATLILKIADMVIEQND
jgi:hypothetical protein